MRFFVISEAIKAAFGEKNYEEGIGVMFEMLQKPKLNKQVRMAVCKMISQSCFNAYWLQLSYTLLDELLREAFPELLGNVQRRSSNQTIATLLSHKTPL